jgi:transcriptional regulator with XRE-family HTH domain
MGPPRDEPRESPRERSGYGRRLMKARLARGMRQQEAAKHLGISLATWKRYESSPTRPRNGLARLALDDFIATAPKK